MGVGPLGLGRLRLAPQGLVSLAIGAESFQHPLGGTDQIQLQGGDELGAHLVGIGGSRRWRHGWKCRKAEANAAAVPMRNTISSPRPGERRWLGPPG